MAAARISHATIQGKLTPKTVISANTKAEKPSEMGANTSFTQFSMEARKPLSAARTWVFPDDGGGFVKTALGTGMSYTLTRTGLLKQVFGPVCYAELLQHRVSIRGSGRVGRSGLSGIDSSFLTLNHVTAA